MASPCCLPGVDCACLYCVAGSLGMWESVCIGLGEGGGGIRCEVEQKEKEAGQGSCTECFES